MCEPPSPCQPACTPAPGCAPSAPAHPSPPRLRGGVAPRYEEVEHGVHQVLVTQRRPVGAGLGHEQAQQIGRRRGGRGAAGALPLLVAAAARGGVVVAVLGRAAAGRGFCAGRPARGRAGGRDLVAARGDDLCGKVPHRPHVGPQLGAAAVLRRPAGSGKGAARLASSRNHAGQRRAGMAPALLFIHPPPLGAAGSSMQASPVRRHATALFPLSDQRGARAWGRGRTSASSSGHSGIQKRALVVRWARSNASANARRPGVVRQPGSVPKPAAFWWGARCRNVHAWYAR
jgi:hypothetical protein